MKKEDKIIHELEEAIRSAHDKGDLVKESDKHIELFTQLRSFDRTDEARKAAVTAYSIAQAANVRLDILLSVRCCAETSAEMGDETGTMRYLKEYEDLVAEDHTELQLMLTVGSWCLLQLFSFDDRRDRLNKARQYAEKSLEMLKSAQMNTKKLREGETFGIREIHCLRMLAASTGNLGEKELALKYSRKAYDLSAGYRELRFDVVRSWLDFPWKDRMEVAQELVNLSNCGKKRVEAYIWLADAFLRNEKIDKGINALFEINDIVTSKGGDDEKEKFPKLLIFAYKAEHRMLLADKARTKGDTANEYHQHDKLGDLFDEAGYKATSLAHYEMALKLAESQSQKRVTLVSCAETCVDLKRFKRAAELFDRVKLIEFNMGKDTTATLVSLFKSRLCGDLFDSEMAVHGEIDRLEKIQNNPLLDVVYEAASKYFASKNKPKEAERFRKLEQDAIAANGRSRESHEEEEEEEITALDDIDDMEDNWILGKMRDRAKEAATRKSLRRCSKKKNSYGETKLMELAREGTLDQVKFLLEQGHDVNKPDPVGWTPLSEAVAANNLDIVKYLLTKGANPKSKSNTGWAETNFGGGITPLMEACTNGFHECAAWLLHDRRAQDLVMATNVDGWSPADFLTDYLKRASRGEESEDAFQKQLSDCRNVLDKIKIMQRKGGFPVRQGDPPVVLQKSDDTKSYAKDKARAKRNEKRGEGRKGAAENYRDTITKIRTWGADEKERGKKKRKEKESDDSEESGEEDEVEMFNDSDDEPLVRPCSSGSKTKGRRRVRLSSDSEDDEKEKEKENKRRRSLDRNESMFGLDDDGCGRRSSQGSRGRGGGGGGATPRLSGVQRILQKKCQKRSMERGDENGISIVPDDAEEIVVIDERRETKRRRNDSEGSQSECSRSFIDSSRVSIASHRDIMEMAGAATSAAPSPSSFNRSDSRSSLTSASMLAASMPIRIVVVRGEQREKLLRSFPSGLDIADLPSHYERLRELIGGADVEWMMGETKLDSPMPLGDLPQYAEKLPVEIECRVEMGGKGEKRGDSTLGERPPSAEKKTLKGEFEKRCDQSDRGSALSAALDAFEKSRFATLSIDGGAKYSEESREAVWSVLAELAAEKEKEGKRWRIESIQVHQWGVSSSAVRCLSRLPCDSLTLRLCGMDDEKLAEMAEAMEESVTGAAATLKTLDLSFNDGITTGDSIVKILEKTKGIKILILQGSTGIEDGSELMKTIGGLPLHSLVLDENPWLDDGCMKEMMRGEKEKEKGKGLNTLKISKCSIRSMAWLEGENEALASLKALSIAENNGVSAQGWDRVAGFLRSSSSSGLRSIDLSGTSVRPTVLDALAARPSSSTPLTATLTRCTLITSSEIYRILSPLVTDPDASPNLKLMIEAKKLEEVREISPILADRVLKAAKKED